MAKVDGRTSAPTGLDVKALSDADGLVDFLATAFVGGEPTLCPFLGALIERAHQRGLTTCVVSNGARLLPILRDHSESLDWVGLSVDSADEAINQALGRGQEGMSSARSGWLARRATAASRSSSTPSPKG